MEKIYNIVEFDSGQLTTQDDFVLSTQGVFIDVQLTTQNGDILLTQNGDIIEGMIIDADNVFTIGYQVRANKDYLLNYIDQSKINAVNTSEKLYNPSITEKIYGN
jgi:hypothetical protein